MVKSVNRKIINGVPVDVIKKSELFFQLDQLLGEVPYKRCSNVFFLNAHCFNMAIQDREYNNILHEADYVLNDGLGVQIAGRLNGIKFPDNLVGTDLIPDFLAYVGCKKLKVFFYGSKPGIVDDLIEKYNHKEWNLDISGVHGYVNNPMDGDVVSLINSFEADIVILGLGVPLQEKWVSKFSKLLTTTKITLAGGAIIDNMSGSIPRAPLWVRRLKCEWLFRLYLEPSRLAKRYILGIPLFFLYIAVKKQRFS